MPNECGPRRKGGSGGRYLRAPGLFLRFTRRFSLGVTWVKGGNGFTWEAADLGTSQKMALSAWWQAAEALESGRYRLVVLDEVTYPIMFGWIGLNEVVDAIRRRSGWSPKATSGRCPSAPDATITP